MPKHCLDTPSSPWQHFCTCTNSATVLFDHCMQSRCSFQHKVLTQVTGDDAVPFELENENKVLAALNALESTSLYTSYWRFKSIAEKASQNSVILHVTCIRQPDRHGPMNSQVCTLASMESIFHIFLMQTSRHYVAHAVKCIGTHGHGTAIIEANCCFACQHATPHCCAQACNICQLPA